MGTTKISASKAKRVNYMADFETTTDADDCRVWHWGAVPIEAPTAEHFFWGTTIDEFIEWCQTANLTVYFHNLKFDATFIMDWLLKNGYVFSETKYKLQPGEFKALISDMGKFFSVTVAWKNGTMTEFRDSLKKLPMSLKRVAESFGLEIAKGSIDYEMARPVGYEPTVEEIDYLEKDVLIGAQALHREFEQGMTKLTVASDSMAEFKRLFGDKRFKRTFPQLPEAMDAEIRGALRGGWTYADERHRGKRCSGGLVLDVNSLYPYVMYTAFLPYGEPRYFSGRHTDTNYTLSIFSVTFEAVLKKKHVPCIQIKGNVFYANTEYIKNTVEPTTLWCTNVDWELWNEHYDITVLSWNGGWAFKGAHGFFDDYIDKWMAIKATSKGGLREIAKLHLNGLFGKFGSNPNTTGKCVLLQDDHVKLESGTPETRPPVYTAMACFITAYARAITVRAAQVNYDSFAYADTDSLHLLRDTVPEGIAVHPSDIGAWKLEYTFTKALYVRAKFYLEQHADGTYTNRMAGVPEPVSELLTFADITEGKVLDRAWMTKRSGDPLRSAKLTPKNVPGGVVLVDSPFTIKL